MTPTQPPPFPPFPKNINKQKERKNLGKNERIESNRPETRKQKKTGLTNSRDTTLHVCMYPYTKRSIYLSRAVSRTHARTTTPNKKDSVHPSIHSSLTTSHRKVYLPAIKSHTEHGIRGRPTSQREREIFILSRPYHRVRLHLTSARLISAHRSRRRGRRRRRRERRRLSNQLYCAASDPIQFSHPSVQLKGM